MIAKQAREKNRKFLSARSADLLSDLYGWCVSVDSVRKPLTAEIVEEICRESRAKDRTRT